MRTLICTVGLPRSGKTTWALAQGLPIVSADAIRLAIHGRRYWQAAEPLVHAHVWMMCRAMFLAGHNTIILDETMNTHKRRHACREQGQFLNTSWVCKFHHITTPKEICIERARDVDDDEIIPVIERMAKEFEPLGKGEEVF